MPLADGSDPADVMIGVHTHKDVYVAHGIGRRLGEFTVDANPASIAGLLEWTITSSRMEALGQDRAERARGLDDHQRECVTDPPS